MKTHSTDQLLTLGMALTSDRRSMERRVRGVFARKRSAKSALALSLVLAFTLGFAAFTTACQPGQPLSTDGNAVVSGGDAVVSGGDVVTSGGNAVATDTSVSADEDFSKAEAMQVLTDTLGRARELIVPRMESIAPTERGDWQLQQNPDANQMNEAAASFLKVANSVFDKAYTPEDLTAKYYIDNTGFRADVWRFDSKDGVLAGAVEAKTLTFLSADCINEPADALHSSVTKDKVDATATIERIAKLLGGKVGAIEWRGGFSRAGATNGWMIKRDVLFPLGDGRFCAVSLFADENLTPTTVCVFPDQDCGNESVYWRADLDWTEGATSLLYPKDFKVGTPGADDMTQQDAIAFFQKLVETAGLSEQAASEPVQEPTATFYVDHSGARENYWQIDGNNITLELTSKTGRMLSLTADSRLGSKLGLGDIPYEKMGGKEYSDATEKLFVALFGKEAIKEIQDNAVYDDHYCTMDPMMADGTQYEIMFNDGMIVEVASFYKIDPNTWPSIPEWLKEYAKVDNATGEITIPGFENGTWKIVPDWLADWVYKNNETGEVYAKEW